MTKTLTEKWREGKLQFGFYYVKFPNEEPQIYSSEYLKSFTVVKDAGKIDILAPVPSYDEDKKLKDQIADLSKKVKTLIGLLEHALRTMGQIAKLSEDKVDAVQCATSICLIQERLKEMEGVK